MKQLLITALMLCIAARPVIAQQPPALDRAEAFAADGKYSQARAALAQWWNAHKTPKPADGPQVARALLLRARLTMHPDTAERDYLRIVLEHPSSPQTPEALLRLGQHFLARGDTQRARTYLHRLASDYPGSSQRATALTFLARADSAKPEKSPPAREAMREPAPKRKRAEIADLQPTAIAPQQTAERDSFVPRQPPRSAPVTTKGAGAYALQSGAFRLQTGAVDLAARLRKAGYDARVVSAGGELRLVRIGQFATTKDAVAVAKRIRADGFAAVVVDDVAREKAVHR